MNNVYSVGQVNEYIRRMFDADSFLMKINVRGEISNLSNSRAGHTYFTLKDASGTLSCAFFANRKRGVSFPFREGDQIIASGTIGVYVKTGSYQLYVDRVYNAGAGALNLEYERLKRKLEAEGLFDARHKVPIPKYITRLGVVTAPGGAAVHDIIRTATQRNPHLQIYLYPATVQGEEAPQSIIEGIRALDAFGVDTIIIGRGGGSIEDLWGFNDERVAHAVYDCRTPIISAVGHETDFVITDFVADARALTPTGAAEMAVYDWRIFMRDLQHDRQLLLLHMSHCLRNLREAANSCSRELAQLSPASRIRERRMSLAHMQDRMMDLMIQRISSARAQAGPEQVHRMKLAMDRRIADARQQSDMSGNLKNAMESRIRLLRQQLQICASQLDADSPLKRISGGYGFITGRDGKAVLSAAEVEPQDALLIRLCDGSIHATADRVDLSADSGIHPDRDGKK